MNKKNIIIANWKMNHSFDEAEKWLKTFDKEIAAYKPLKADNMPDIVLCPPAILIDHIDGLLMEDKIDELEETFKDLDNVPEEKLEEFKLENRDLKLGGQDCAYEISGAFTGDISAATLRDAGCDFVILGHSERRANHHESNEIIAKKVTIAVEQELTPILCVGESQELRQANKYLGFIEEQINNSAPKGFEMEELIIAYEPIWSIGTGIIPTTDQISEMAKFITDILKKNKDIKAKNYRILYGGSTKKSNAAEILAVENINGLLIGGASLDADEFFEIVKLA